MSAAAASLWFAFSFDKHARQAITVFNTHALRASTDFELASNAFHQDIGTVSALLDDQVAFLGKKVDEVLEFFRRDREGSLHLHPWSKVRVPVKDHSLPIFKIEDSRCVDASVMDIGKYRPDERGAQK